MRRIFLAGLIVAIGIAVWLYRTPWQVLRDCWVVVLMCWVFGTVFAATVFLAVKERRRCGSSDDGAKAARDLDGRQ